MLKINQNTKKIFNFSLNLFILTLTFFLTISSEVYAANNNWIEITKTPNGIQYLDKDSVSKKDKGVIEITTKYLKIDANTSNEIDENIYIMRINCLTNKFKDISVNGTINLSAKWKAPGGDKLINDVILYNCKNV
ncbi:hypothetical protein [Prochlorococcus marinus]|uniref:Uncharacterized protein n=1 Tax=Prochlorococcus marinus XMU1408 TaxID=2213228 RepID=A0A318R438_PROMR|nr:hypothetical protein [Prochlorococcus marinus]MBW3041787.1 hypothetical protein [Prochlorococcus marinus str. XMU1408]PYE02930.1 hypothetical protein DNJ73_04055 [Prochlorococcus marinus XMU1408]